MIKMSKGRVSINIPREKEENTDKEYLVRVINVLQKEKSAKTLAGF
jgi:hypothetical protein